MKKVLTLGILALVVFGASAFGSWKWQQIRLGQSEDMAGSAEETTGGSDVTKVPEPPSAADHVSPTKGPQASTVSSPSSADNLESRVTVRPSYTAGVEEIVQLGSSVRDRLSGVRERESQLATRQAQLELIQQDIRGERALIEELRKQVSDELKAAEEQVASAERKHSEIEIRQQGIVDSVTQFESQEKDNIKKMGGVYDSMAPEAAAKILQHMADTGTIDTAVKLLGVMKERQAAKVLAELADPSLAAQLSERLKGLKRPQTPANK